jgi:HAD superfamily phosphatase (TIGR01668 family)
VDGTGDSVDTLRPDAHIASLVDVEIDELWERGVRGIVLDLDNTCCAYHQPELADGVAAWVAAALERGLRIVMLSNNFSERVAAAGAQLGVPTVPNALKPLPFGFLRALKLLGTRRRQTVVIGDQVFTDMLGGKLLGLRTVLTEPIVAHDFPLTRVLRLAERLVYKRTPPVPGLPFFRSED